VFRPYPVEPSLIPIERPRCRRCRVRMTLARIEPRPASSVLRTFECPQCERVLPAEHDPIRSHVAWLNSSELRPPK
jgi:hypothetical protein